MPYRNRAKQIQYLRERRRRLKIGTWETENETPETPRNNSHLKSVSRVSRNRNPKPETETLDLATYDIAETETEAPETPEASRAERVGEALRTAGKSYSHNRKRRREPEDSEEEEIGLPPSSSGSSTAKFFVLTLVLVGVLLEWTLFDFSHVRGVFRLQSKPSPTPTPQTVEPAGSAMYGVLENSDAWWQ